MLFHESVVPTEFLAFQVIHENVLEQKSPQEKLSKKTLEQISPSKVRKKLKPIIHITQYDAYPQRKSPNWLNNLCILQQKVCRQNKRIKSSSCFWYSEIGRLLLMRSIPFQSQLWPFGKAAIKQPAKKELDVKVFMHSNMQMKSRNLPWLYIIIHPKHMTLYVKF